MKKYKSNILTYYTCTLYSPYNLLEHNFDIMNVIKTNIVPINNYFILKLQTFNLWL